MAIKPVTKSKSTSAKGIVHVLLLKYDLVYFDKRSLDNKLSSLNVPTVQEPCIASLPICQYSILKR